MPDVSGGATFDGAGADRHVAGAVAMTEAQSVGADGVLTGGELDAGALDIGRMILVCVVITTLWCLPGCCRALPSNFLCAGSAKRFFHRWLWVYGRVVTIFNVCLLVMELKAADAISINEFFFAVVDVLSAIMDQVESILIVLLILIVLVLIVALKDRILLVLGVERGESVLRYKCWDILTCFLFSRFEAIELFIWKMENLPLSASDVFVEARLGYNEAMMTRVHTDAGANVNFCESFQLNFDPNDAEEFLVLQIKNQGVLGTGQIARVAMSGEDIRRMLTDTGWDCPTKWDPEMWDRRHFREISLVPQGTIWVRIAPVDDRDEAYNPLRTHLVSRVANFMSFGAGGAQYQRYERTHTETIHTGRVPLHTRF
jgi:hypothetical protein